MKSPSHWHNLGDIGLQRDNHRLIGQSQTVHFVGSHTHDERFSCTHLMVADATAVLEEHPYTVLLGLVDVLHIETAAAKSLHIDTGEGLVTAIVFRLDKAVELTVIHLLQFIALVLGQIGKVVRKTLADFLNLRAGQLDFLHVRRLDVVAVIVGTHTLLNIYSPRTQYSSRILRL